MPVGKYRKDRSLIKYAVCGSHGLGSKQSKHLYGVLNLKNLTERIEASLYQAELIRDEIMSIASIQEKAMLRSFGIAVQDSEESSEDGSGSDTEEIVDLNWLSDEDSTDVEEGISKLSSTESKENDITDAMPKNDQHKVNNFPLHEQLLNILRKNDMNWFAFLEVKLCLRILLKKKCKVKHSRQAFLELVGENLVNRKDDFTVHTDSESDNPEEWTKVSDALSVEGQSMIKKQ